MLHHFAFQSTRLSKHPCKVSNRIGIHHFSNKHQLFSNRVLQHSNQHSFNSTFKAIGAEWDSTIVEAVNLVDVAVVEEEVSVIMAVAEEISSSKGIIVGHMELVATQALNLGIHTHFISGMKLSKI